MAYKAIKDAKWMVKIHRGIMHDIHYFWQMSSEDFMGMSVLSQLVSGGCGSIEAAEADFKEFAEINGITNYQFQYPRKK